MKFPILHSLLLGASLLSTAAFAQSGLPIVIGLSTPITGNAASFADPERRGVEMAVEEVNAAGGVLGRPLKLVVADNRCNPTEGVQSANKLINDDKAVALIGAFCSSVSLAIMPVVRRSEVPLVIDVSTAPAISQQIGKGRNTWVFRTSVTDDGMAKALIDHLADKSSWRKIAVLAEDTDYGRGGIRAFSELAKARGITTTTTEVVQQGTADFTTVITKLLASKPDAVAVYVLGADMANFLKQYDAWGAKVPVTGRFDPALLSPEQRAKGFLDGSIGVLPYSPDIDTPANKRFVAAYRQRNSADPQFQSAYGYEAVHLIADAIRRAGKAERGVVREALTKSRMNSMVGTPIEFDASHQAHSNAVILLLKDGKTRILSLSPT